MRRSLQRVRQVDERGHRIFRRHLKKTEEFEGDDDDDAQIQIPKSETEGDA
jgi:hypothetical protein